MIVYIKAYMILIIILWLLNLKILNKSLEEIFSETKKINKKIIVDFYKQFLIIARKDLILEEPLRT